MYTNGWETPGKTSISGLGREKLHTFEGFVEEDMYSPENDDVFPFARKYKYGGFIAYRE